MCLVVSCLCLTDFQRIIKIIYVLFTYKNKKKHECKLYIRVF